jgi:hypothetical protein
VNNRQIRVFRRHSIVDRVSVTFCEPRISLLDEILDRSGNLLLRFWPWIRVVVDSCYYFRLIPRAFRA